VTDTTNTDDEFSYDTTPAGGATTLTDAPQGDSAEGGDEYDDLDGPADYVPPPTGKVKCLGFCSAPRTVPKDGVTYIGIDFTAVEPEEVAGRKESLFGPVKGGNAASRQRHLEAIAKLCKQVGVTFNRDSLKSTLKDLKAGLEAAGSSVKYELSPGRQGGTFVNL